jgi:uncharacterized protein YvpB
MNSMYVGITIAITALLILLKTLKGAGPIFKSAALFLFVLFVIAAGLLVDNSRTDHVARAMSALKGWVQSPVSESGGFMEDAFDMPIIKIQDHVLLDVPVISQLPELPRGCEVSSLAMLLHYAGIKADKMILAGEVKKDLTPREVINGEIHFGNPHAGFVGDMYAKDKPGYGVYHEPIRDLAEKYLPGKIKDVTGSDFQELKIHLSDNRPVWVITNIQYQELTQDQFQTWNTPTGKVQITFKEHAVVITGYDAEFIYFNDPLTGEKNKKAPIKEFEESWVQMGRQAITYLPL